MCDGMEEEQTKKKHKLETSGISGINNENGVKNIPLSNILLLWLHALQDWTVGIDAEGKTLFML